jgi:hypothetical protein
VLLARKRIAWYACLDMPIGLALRQPPGTDAVMTGEIILGDPGLRYSGPFTASEEQGWLVVLGITNLGFAPVLGRDFSASLTFAFPGREIRATQISAESAACTASKLPHLPAVHISAGNDQEPGPADSRIACLELTGDFLLHPRDSYSLMLVLSGTPAEDSRRIQQEGSLIGGKIISDRPGSS